MRRNIFISIVIVCLSILLVGCGAKKEEKKVVSTYIYQHRSMGQQNYIEASTEFSGGNGSEESPYEIRSEKDLQLLADVLELNDERAREYSEKYFVLTDDICLNDTSDYDNWAKQRPEFDWKPIGTGKEFQGVFDGAGHTISGLYVNLDVLDSVETYNRNYGLFAEMHGTVKNLNLEKAYVEVSGESSKVGLIAGQLIDGIVIDCKIDGIVKGYDGDYGGIVGQSSGTIRNCSFSGEIEAKKVAMEAYSNFGGIAGSSGFNYEKNSLGIVDCKNYGTIISTEGKRSAEKIGGIVGDGHGVITGCVNEGDIEAKDSLSNDSVGIGGIAGGLTVASNSGNAVIKNCVNKGKVVGTSTLTGGIVGQVYSGDSRYELLIEDCVNEGEETSTSSCAGIVADISASSGDITIKGCTNKSNLQGEFVAGIVDQMVLNGNNVCLVDNKNDGEIKSSNPRTAGVLGYVFAMGNDWSLTIDSCLNSGNIEGKSIVGGIVGSTKYMNTSGENETSFTIKNCENTGNLTSTTANGDIGGILCVDCFDRTKTQISGCKNYGDILFSGTWDVLDEDLDGDEEDKNLSVLVLGGGIVGRIGSSTLAAAKGDDLKDKLAQQNDAMVSIVNCQNEGKLRFDKPRISSDLTKEEIDSIHEDNWRIYLGGILGTCTYENEYSVSFDNCKWTSGRGIGNPDFPDIK